VPWGLGPGAPYTAMTAYILRRILYLIPTFFGATFLAFLIIQMAPGDYLTQLELDPKVTPETIARLRSQFGLDRPVYEQYLLWMNNLLHLNLGYSFAFQAPVLEVIWPRVVNSMVIVIPSTILLYLVAIPIGVYGAVRQYSLGDRILSFLAYVGLSVPSFFLALIAIYVLLQIKFKTGSLHLPGLGDDL
jgi:peptide/nickel transport system permease protein